MSAQVTARRWWALAVIALAQFMVIMDTSIIGVALPEIQQDLGFDQNSLSWVFNAYVIAFGGLLLLGGRLSDLFGARRLFTAGWAILLAGSLVAGFAEAIWVELAGRAIQGVGAAFIAPAALTLLMMLFGSEPRELTKALALYGAAAPAGGTAGVFLGGVLTDGLSWEWVFFVNVPIALVALAATSRLMPAAQAQRGKVDLAGAVTVTAGLAAAVFAIVRAPEEGWGSPLTLSVLAGAVLALAAFVEIQRVRSAPLVRLGIFRTPNLGAANLAQLMLGAAWIPMWFFLNLYLQQVLGLGAFEGGAALLPMTVAIMIMMVVGVPKLMTRFAVRWLVAIGMQVLAAGMLWLSFVRPDGTFAADVLPATLVAAAGMALAFIPSLATAISSARPEEGGLASGIVNTSYQVGSALGLAAMTALAASQGAEQLGNPEALTDGFSAAFLGAAAIAVVGGLVALTIKLRRPSGPEVEPPSPEQPIDAGEGTAREPAIASIPRGPMRGRRTSALSALTFPAGRRAKWMVLAVGVLLVLAAGSQAGKFEDALNQEASSYLPGDSESLAVVEAAERLPAGEQLDGIVVYQRASGLTDSDRDRIAGDRRELNEDPPPSLERVPPPVVSEDGTAALLALRFALSDASDDRFLDAAEQVREVVGEGSGGLAIALGGPAGFAADGFEIFEQIDGALLLGTAALVVLLLIAIYRSPIFWLLPFLAILMAEIASRGLGFGLTEVGIKVNAQSASILVVLVFGAGTDYALLLLARYREELRRHEDKHAAMAIALRRAGPAILASGATVIAALLCLTLAELNGTAGLGPIGAMGVALATIASLTLLPALVLVGGRRAFWPFVPRHGASGAEEHRGAWRRVGDRVGRSPRRTWVATAALLAVMCAGLAWLNSDLTSADGFRGDVESVKAQELLAGAFPAGGSAPTEVLVQDSGRLEEVRSALAEAPGVAEVGQVQRGEPGALIDVTLKQDPFSLAAFELVPELRAVAKRAGGESTLVGGASAVEHDVRESATRDTLVIVPIVLAVVFLILAALLRALVAPALLVATVIVSFGAALGVGSFAFENLFGFEGIDPTMPLFAFIFLVALGVDYNIFLMVRAREETLQHGNREGTIRALTATGTVITSAGLVLAGTFSILGVLPLVPLTELGLTVAFGVLLDTFLVRSVLVPALVIDVGERTWWWPSRLASGETGSDARPDGGPATGRTAQPSGSTPASSIRQPA